MNTTDDFDPELSRILSNHELSTNLNYLLELDDSLSSCPLKDSDSHSVPFEFRSMVTFDVDTLDGEWQGLDIVNTLDVPIRRARSEQQIQLVANSLASSCSSSLPSCSSSSPSCSSPSSLCLLFLTCQLGSNSSIANSWDDHLLVQSSSTPLHPLYTHLLACLSRCAHCPVATLQPGGETSVDVDVCLDHWLNHVDGDDTSDQDQQVLLAESVDRLAMLFLVMHNVSYECMNSDDAALLLFALFKLNLDRRLGACRLTIVGVVEKILTCQTVNFHRLADDFKRIFHQLSADLFTISRAFHLLACADHQLAAALSTVVGREVLTGMAEAAELDNVDCAFQAIAEAFCRLSTELPDNDRRLDDANRPIIDDFCENRRDFLAMISIINDAFDSTLIAKVDRRIFDSFLAQTTLVGRKLFKSGLLDDKILDCFLRTLADRCRNSRLTTNPNERPVELLAKNRPFDCDQT